MEWIKPGLNINFVGTRKTWLSISALVVLCSLGYLFARGGPNYGVDFAGGTEIQLKFSDAVEAAEIRSILQEAEVEINEVQQFGEDEDNEFLIKTPGFLMEKSAEGEEISEPEEKPLKEGEKENVVEEGGGGEEGEKANAVEEVGGEQDADQGGFEDLGQQIYRVLEKQFGEGSVEIRRVEMVGPKVGKELRKKGLNAVLYALLGILIYIAWRFDYKYAPGAVLCLIHDVIITVGIYTFVGKELTLPIIAALLTIVGYSLNDTIVVFDRIRENRRRSGHEKLDKVVNRSINETLSRTLLTSLTTLLAVVALMVLGGGIIHDFAFTLMIGVIIGTYSTIYIASPVLIFMEETVAKRITQQKRKGR